MNLEQFKDRVDINSKEIDDQLSGFIETVYPEIDSKVKTKKIKNMFEVG